jgi:hypothetical protein
MRARTVDRRGRAPCLCFPSGLPTGQEEINVERRGVFKLRPSPLEKGESEWWLYGPVSLVLGLLALVVAGSGGAWRIHRRHRMLPSH